MLLQSLDQPVLEPFFKMHDWACLHVYEFVERILLGVFRLE